MVYVDIYNDIGKPDVWLQMAGMEDTSVSASSIKRLLNDNKKEEDFTFNIHCDGGSVSEGLAIYDILRQSGKNLYCNIEGGCHSMAVCFLLAAKKENRTANPNSRALIHRVYAYPYDALNATEARELAADIEREENAILDIYEQRTGSERKVLRELMDAENELTAKELKKYGFISRINTYNTNFKKTRKMAVSENAKRKPAGMVNKPANAKKMTVGQRVDDLVNKITGLVKKIDNALEAEIVNYDYSDSEGNVIFSIEGESDSITVGTVVTFPEGVQGEAGDYELSDGRIITIVETEEGLFEVEAVEDPQVITENLETENKKLRRLNNELATALKEMQKEVVELKNSIGTNFVPEGRAGQPRQPRGNRGVEADPKTNEKRSVEDIKADARERAKANKKGGSQ